MGIGISQIREKSVCYLKERKALLFAWSTVVVLVIWNRKQKQQQQLLKDRAKDLQRQQQQQHLPQWANLHGQPHFFPQEEWATYFFPQLRHQQRMDIEALGRGGLV